MKSRRIRADHRCEFCGEPLAATAVSIYRRRGSRHMLFRKVAALICRACGHRVFEAPAVEMMERELTQPARHRRTAELSIV